MRIPPVLRLLGALMLFAATAPAFAEGEVGVRTGEHPGFGRVVFDFDHKVGFAVTRAGDRVTIRFDPAEPVGQPGRLARNVLGVAGGNGEAQIDVAPGAQLRSMRVGMRVVLDVLDPPPASARAAPPPPRAAARTPPPPREAAAPPRPAVPAPAPVPAMEPPPAPPPAPVASPGPPPAPAEAAHEPVPAPAAPIAPASTTTTTAPLVPVEATPIGPVAIAASRGPGGADGAASLSLPFAAEVGAAAFRRGDVAMVVFDDRRPIDMAGLRADAAFAGATVQLLPAATVLRVKLPPGGRLALSRGPEAWVLTLAGDAAAVRPIVAANAGDRLVLPAAAPGAIVTVPDPETGGNLLVGTQRQPGQGIIAERRTPEFRLLASWQGVAVEPSSDRLAMRVTKDGFTLAAGPAGEVLAMSPIPTNADSLASAGSMTRRFDFPDLPRVALERRLRSSVDAAAAAAPLARAEPRRAAAQAMIALGMGVEAQSMLRLATADDPAAAADPDMQGLAAIAATLAGRLPEADAIDDPRLSGSDEVTLWRAARRAASREGDPTAAELFATSAPLIPGYPAALRDWLAPLAAETLIKAGQTAAAARLLDALPAEPPTALARAMLDEAAGRTEPALAAYDALAAGADQLVSARAIRHGIDLRLASGAIDAAAAADALEQRLFAWRGDRREVATRLRLADLQQQAGSWRAALTGLRDAEALFPDAKDDIRAQLTAAFSAMLQSDRANSLPALELVAAIEENADLATDGPGGEALSARLADRLLALDLPRRAAPLLEKLMNAAPAGPRRAGLGQRLAALRLAEGDAHGALKALADSAAEGLPDAVAQPRTVLLARAAAARGDVPRAVAALLALGTPAADEARAAILETARDWPGAAAALAEYAARSVPADGQLNDAQRRTLVRLARAASQAGDAATLASLRQRDGDRMATGADANLFALLTAAPVQGVADLPRAGREVALARHAAEAK